MALVSFNSRPPYRSSKRLLTFIHKSEALEMKNRR